MEKDLKFPTFECMISNTVEQYDSDVEMYFIKNQELSTRLAELRFSDPEFKENYEKMLNYLKELSHSIVYKTEPPTHQFLIDLCMGPEDEGDTLKLLMESKDRVVPQLIRSSLIVREMMFWFVRMSKIPSFSEGFTVDRFQGFSFLRLALVYRALKINGN
ncbi:hypothetical protein OXIME_001040 [Oxyplasma meridianum]|uniref:Uncharacterized protein n=1 Tax=Oxyplasma meridianum TaxID=3073602 RepID=A0AAX4NH64_9ARCH